MYTSYRAPPSQWVWEFFPGGKSGRGVKLTAYLYPVPRLQMHRAIPPFHHFAFMVCLIK